MISCTKFIPAYSNGFKFIEEAVGRKELENFWSFLSDTYLKDTQAKLVSEGRLEGCFTYMIEIFQNAVRPAEAVL